MLTNTEIGAISATHIHKTISTLRMTKAHRLSIRFAIALVITLLALAGARLNSTQLIGTVTALVVLTLATELWAASCTCQSLCDTKRRCRYEGRCRKQEMRILAAGQKADEKTDEGATAVT